MLYMYVTIYKVLYSVCMLHMYVTIYRVLYSVCMLYMYVNIGRVLYSECMLFMYVNICRVFNAVYFLRFVQCDMRFARDETASSRLETSWIKEKGKRDFLSFFFIAY